MRRHVLNARRGGAILVRGGVGRAVACHVGGALHKRKQPICPIAEHIERIKSEKPMKGGSHKHRVYMPLQFKV